MIRRDGFLNFAQLTQLVWDEWHDDLMHFEPSDASEPDYPSADERRRAFAFWGARTIIDNMNEAAVFDGSGGFARLDAWCIFYPKRNVEYEFASDIPIEKPVTKASLALYEYRLNSGWEFVRGAIGIVGVRRGLWERVMAKEDKQVSRFRNYLMPFHGWTVAINEKDARAALKDIGPSVATRAEGQGEIGLLEYTYQCFVSKFPQGKGGTPWREVEKKTGFSRRHIVRALKAFDTQK